jgi:hypothetical protein
MEALYQWNEVKSQLQGREADIPLWIRCYQRWLQIYIDIDKKIEYSVSFSLRTLTKEFDKRSMQQDMESLLLKIFFHSLRLYRGT